MGNSQLLWTSFSTVSVEKCLCQQVAAITLGFQDCAIGKLLLGHCYWGTCGGTDGEGVGNAGSNGRIIAMQRLFPLPAGSVSPQGATNRTRSPHRARPWVLLNMVTSIDGAAASQGLSGGLSSTADKTMFAALRARADVILVGASTANAERYGPARRSGARIAVVSGSLSADPQLPLFAAPAETNPGETNPGETNPAPLPLIVTTTNADPADAERYQGHAEMLRCGESQVDLAAALAALHARGTNVVLCEGGPTLNGHLLAADLVDEINLTYAPLIVNSVAPRIATGPPTGRAPGSPYEFELEQVVTADGALFVRWRRRRP